MKIILLLLLSALLSGCASSPQKRFTRQNPVQKTILPQTVSIHTGWLEAAFAPDSMGRMVNLKYCGEEILARFERTALIGNPLFEPVNCNVFGFRELFWGVRMTTLDLPAALVSKSENQIVFSAPNYGNTPLDLLRKVTLRPDGSVIEFDLTISNSSAKSYAYQLWLNLLPRTPYAPLIPLQDGLKKEFKLGNNFHPAGDCWIAARLQKPDAVAALSWQPEEMIPGGQFYVHGAQQFNTFEAILGKRVLKPGARNRHAYKLLLFPALPALNALLGEIGLAAVPDGDACRLMFAAASPSKPQSAGLKTAGKIQKIVIPPMKAGDISVIRVPSKPDSVIMNGREYMLF